VSKVCALPVQKLLEGRALRPYAKDEIEGLQPEGAEVYVRAAPGTLHGGPLLTVFHVEHAPIYSRDPILFHVEHPDFHRLLTEPPK
jgi:hypothetical protein